MSDLMGTFPDRYPLPRVMAAAIKKDGRIYYLPQPARHDAVIKYVVQLTHERVRSEDEQGFLLDDGRFVGRKEAAEIAFAAGQIQRLPGPVVGLTSEDVW